MSRVREIGWKTIPISDRCSTFGFNRLRLLSEAEGLRPIYGVELGVVSSLGEKKPSPDFWRFLSIDSIRPINELVGDATANPGKEPSLRYDQAMGKKGVFKICGSRVKLNFIEPRDDLFVGLDPSVSRGLFLEARKRGFRFLASSCNMYPREEDLELYRVTIGRRSSTQTYPQHILSDEEWWESINDAVSDEEKMEAIALREYVFSQCNAKMKMATIFVPDKPKTLREMCSEGAISLNIDLTNHVYAERLDRELKLIAEKNFEDYFYLVADIMQFARTKMIVGPARGSSCGSLVCYLLHITSVDPIPYDLVFERFIDVTRKDYPDIDCDFSETRRHLVFEYVEQKYGKEHAARLGTISMFQSRSALNAIGAALKIPKWMVEKVSNSVIIRSKGDSRADLKVEDTLKETDAGRELMAAYPEAEIVSRMESHPSNAGQHAAGVVITDEPLVEYVAVDSRTNSAMCDWVDAKDLNLLKLDALGLTQLSIFERTLELLGKPQDNRWLESLPLDDQEAFDVINSRRFSGIFQFTGPTLQNIAIEVKVSELEDFVAMTALCRPGPIGSGSTRRWIDRKNGEKVELPHPIFEPYMSKTLGVMIYQEQVLRIGREIGGLSWAEVTELRKSMSKSLGKEHFDRYGDPWKKSAIEKGVPPAIAEKFWEETCNYGMYCLSGDTKLINPYPNQTQPKSITLKKLYEQEGYYKRSLRLPKNRRKKFKLHCLQGGKIKPAPVVDVTYSGKRETWLVEADTGETIRATMEHRFLCSDMKYRPLKELKSGDPILLMDKRPLPPKKGTGSGGHNWWWKLKSGQPLLKRQIVKLKKIYKSCQICKRRPYQITHHINEDHDDQRWENLLPVCRSCHQKIHHSYVPNSIGKIPRASHIISISEPKIEDTYDVTMPTPHNNFVANKFIVHNSFNRSHSVAYALVSYWACYLKAHYPVEFAAATLDAEKESIRQIQILRELAKEGIDYVPVDPDLSIDRWVPAERGENKRRMLIGPLTQIKGIGPASVREILDARKRGAEIRPVLRKKIEAAKTSIDTLYPVSSAVSKIWPDLRDCNIITKPTQIDDVQPGRIDGDFVIICQLVKLHPLDENEPARVAKRGKKVTGPTKAVNFFVRDDSGEIFCKISRYDYDRLAPTLMNGTKQGNSLFAIKGNCPDNFRMTWVSNIKYLGEP